MGSAHHPNKLKHSTCDMQTEHTKHASNHGLAIALRLYTYSTWPLPPLSLPCACAPGSATPFAISCPCLSNTGRLPPASELTEIRPIMPSCPPSFASSQYTANASQQSHEPQVRSSIPPSRSQADPSATKCVVLRQIEFGGQRWGPGGSRILGVAGAPIDRRRRCRPLTWTCVWEGTV